MLSGQQVHLIDIPPSATAARLRSLFKKIETMETPAVLGTSNDETLFDAGDEFLVDTHSLAIVRWDHRKDK